MAVRIFSSLADNFYTIDCSGTGSPTVVMEAAASAPWSLWRKVQPELSRITQVCSYDRAGHGWSDPRKGPRDAETIVQEKTADVEIYWPSRLEQQLKSIAANQLVTVKESSGLG